MDQRLRLGVTSLRGGPFDMWGAMVFLCDQTFFRLPAFFTPYQKQTISVSQQLNTKQFFSPFFLFDYPQTPSSEVSPHLPGLFTMIFDKESYCVKYVEQNY